MHKSRQLMKERSALSSRILLFFKYSFTSFAEARLETAIRSKTQGRSDKCAVAPAGGLLARKFEKETKFAQTDRWNANRDGTIL
jgi:hypothetical protein